MSCAIRSKPINRHPIAQLFQLEFIEIYDCLFVIFFPALFFLFFAADCLASAPLAPSPKAPFQSLVTRSPMPPGVKSNYERFMTAGQLHSMSINLATLDCVLGIAVEGGKWLYF